MDFQFNGARIKVLPHVTVHGLETALEKGLKQAVWLHYTFLTLYCCFHFSVFVFLFHVSRSGIVTFSFLPALVLAWAGRHQLHRTFQPLSTCFQFYWSYFTYATMVWCQMQCCRRPHFSSWECAFFDLVLWLVHLLVWVQALMACHAKVPFTVGPSPLETVVSFFNLKLRMLCSKIRNLLISTNWEQLQKKLTSEQRDCFLKLLRCLSSNFSCNGETEMNVAALPFLDELWLHNIFYVILSDLIFLSFSISLSLRTMAARKQKARTCKYSYMSAKGDCLSVDFP